jgi:hypothetical protein
MHERLLLIALCTIEKVFQIWNNNFHCINKLYNKYNNNTERALQTLLSELLELKRDKGQTQL